MTMTAFPATGVTVFEEEIEERAYSVHLMLRLLGIPHKRLHGLGSVGETLLRMLQPGERGALVLADNRLVLSERSAILTYLARRYDQRDSWLPADDPVLFGQTMQWLGRIEQARAATGGVGTRSDGALSRLLLETHLAEQDGNGFGWIVGRCPTIADVAAFAHLAFTGLLRSEADGFPAVQRWATRFRALAGFVAPESLTEEGLRPIQLPARTGAYRAAEFGEARALAGAPQEHRHLTQDAQRSWMRIAGKPSP